MTVLELLSAFLYSFFFVNNQLNKLRGGPFDFWGGVGRFRKIISCNPRRKKKNHAANNRKKNYHAKESAQKKIPTCKSTDVLHFSIVSTGLQDFAFLSRHICLKEHGVNSGQHHTDSTAFREPIKYDSQWRSLAKLLPPLRKSGLKICTSL
jgi:hypothetical protein